MSRPKNDGKGRQGGGRQKGTPNKVTRERRELIKEFLNENWEDFKQMYKESDPERKQKIYLELLPYTTPKLAAVEYREVQPGKTYKDELDELSGEPTRD